MSTEAIRAVKEFAQTVDLYGRAEQVVRSVNSADFKTAVSLCDNAILDAKEMLRPDRTVTRRSVHQKNLERLNRLKEMIEGLST